MQDFKYLYTIHISKLKKNGKQNTIHDCLNFTEHFTVLTLIDNMQMLYCPPINHYWLCELRIMTPLTS
jgi:hypothetical protein